MNSHSSLRSMSKRPWDVAPFWLFDRGADFPALEQDLECDTAIIGGGVIGLSTAFALAGHQRIVVLERDKICEGSSGWNAGVLSLATTVDLRVVEKLFGEATARLLYAQLSSTLDAVLSSLSLSEDILQRGNSLYLASKRRHLKILEDELAIRERYGLPSRLMSAKELPEFVSGFHGGLVLGGENAVQPVRLLSAMAEAVCKSGGRIFEMTPVAAWRHEGSKFVLRAGNHIVRANNLILSTGVYADAEPEYRQINRLLVPVIGEVIVTEASEEIAKMVNETSHIAMWDTLQINYTYARYLPDGRILTGGAEIPGVMRPRILSRDSSFARHLHTTAVRRHRFRIPPVEYAWRASLALPADGLPMLKRVGYDGGTLIVAATDGLPSGFLLGKTIAEILLERSSGLETILSQTRPLAGPARLLALVPQLPAIRRLALRLAFIGMRIQDLLF
ncbi:MAG TPA: FAD-dependent oxidoreductase [Candidatus Obscuribacterales bacterium]